MFVCDCWKGLNVLCFWFLQKFLSKVQEVFLCICCQEVVDQPITTECQHNVCRVRNRLLHVELIVYVELNGS